MTPASGMQVFGTGPLQHVGAYLGPDLRAGCQQRVQQRAGHQAGVRAAARGRRPRKIKNRVPDADADARRAATHRERPVRGRHRRHAPPTRPGPGVLAVVGRPASLAEFQRAERVDHDGQLVEELHPDAALVRTRLRPVRVPAGVQRHRPLPDAGPLARLVVAAAVEHHLVGVDVRVVVGHRDRQRVVVHLARHERADDEAGALEDLVHGRRLVHAAGDGLEVADVEGVRVQAAVPADDVERVAGIDEPGAGHPPRRCGA